MNTADTIDNSRSYATEERLIRALEQQGFRNERHIIVRNREGRWTAIFPGSNNHPAQYAHAGFMVMG